MTALTILSAATGYLCGMVALSAFFPARGRGEGGRNELLFLGGFLYVYLLALLPQWPLWLRLSLGGLVWVLVWRLCFSGSVWRGLLAISGFWAAAAALDAGIFTAFQSVAGTGTRAALLTVICGRALLLTLAFGCGSVRFRGPRQGVWACLFLLDTLAGLGALAGITAESSLPRGAVALGGGLLLVNGLLCLGAVRLEGAQREKDERRRLQAEADRNLELARTYADSFAQQRRLTHEFRNQLAAIGGLLAQKEYDRAADYVAELRQSTQERNPPLHTGNAMADALLSRKLAQAAELGVGMSLSCNDLSGLPIEDGDLVTLLGNVLDNALAASARSREKRVWARLWQERGVCQFVVRNSLPEEPDRERDPQLHGFGSGLIAGVLEKYGCAYVSEVVGGEYVFSTVLG